MVKVDFYQNSSESIEVSKKLKKVATKNLNFKDDVDVVNPSIVTEVDIECNYAYIPNFKRYYYVTKTILTGSRYRYDFSVDVLMSYATSLKNITCTVLRNENLSNAYLHDSEYRTLAYKQYVTKTFPKGFDTSKDSIIINCIGG